MQRLIIILIADLMAIASFYTPVQKQLTAEEIKNMRRIEKCIKILTSENRHIHRHIRYHHHRS